MPYPETAEGFQAQSFDNWSTFKKAEFDLKPFEDDDIDIAIDACGVCGSDVHTITGGWGEAPMPLCVGKIRAPSSYVWRMQALTPE
jgi:alcohol dehydrogenase (NADP+)